MLIREILMPFIRIDRLIAPFSTTSYKGAILNDNLNMAHITKSTYKSIAAYNNGSIWERLISNKFLMSESYVDEKGYRGAASVIRRYDGEIQYVYMKRMLAKGYTNVVDGYISQDNIISILTVDDMHTWGNSYPERSKEYLRSLDIDIDTLLRIIKIGPRDIDQSLYADLLTSAIKLKNFSMVRILLQNGDHILENHPLILNELKRIPTSSLIANLIDKYE